MKEGCMKTTISALVGLISLFFVSCGNPPWMQFSEEQTITSFFEDGDILWVGTKKHGLLKLDRTTQKIYDYTIANSGLPDNDVEVIRKDKKDIKWIGTALGLSKYDGDNWEGFDANNSELPANLVNAIAFESSGLAWIGTANGLASFDGNKWTVYKIDNSDIPDNVINYLAIDNKNILWIGTDNGLCVFNGKNFANIDTQKIKLPTNKVKTLIFDRNGHMWIGTGRGLVYFDGNKSVIYNTRNGLPDNTIQGVTVDNDDHIWVATPKGLAHFDRNTWNVYNTSNSKLPLNRITAVRSDRYGNIWIGTDGKGFLAYNPKGVILTDEDL